MILGSLLVCWFGRLKLLVVCGMLCTGVYCLVFWLVLMMSLCDLYLGCLQFCDLMCGNFIYLGLIVVALRIHCLLVTISFVVYEVM